MVLLDPHIQSSLALCDKRYRVPAAAMWLIRDGGSTQELQRGPQERTHPVSQFRGRHIALGPGDLIAL